MQETCLILGADGFIGSHLVEELLQRNFKVRVFGKFKNNKFRNLNLVKDRIEVYSGDFKNKKDIAKAIKNADYVFHFISFSNPGITSRKPIKEIEMNLLPTIHLLELCSKSNVKKVIYPSSGGSIYGKSKKKYLSEDSNLQPVTPYAINKLTTERFLFYYFNQRGLDYTIYRIANVYGERQFPKGDQGVIQSIIRKTLRNEEVPIYGNSVRDYIHIQDVASFIANNFDKKGRHKIYNLGSGKGIKLSKLVRIIEKTLNKKVKIKQMDIREFDIDHVILDISRIKNEFFFKPAINIIKGIGRTYKYIKNEQNNE